jgi:hypothetical protein
MLYPLTGASTCCIFARLGLEYGASRTVIFIKLVVDFVKMGSIAFGCFSQAAKAIKPSHPRFGATAPIHEPATAHIMELLAGLYHLRLSYLYLFHESVNASFLSISIAAGGPIKKGLDRPISLIESLDLREFIVLDF